MSQQPGIQSQIDRFLRQIYDNEIQSNYSRSTPLEEIAERTGLPPRLVEKISKYLEGAGLLEYDHRAVDLTIEGIRKAEALGQAPVKVPTTYTPSQTGFVPPTSPPGSIPS